LNLPDGSITISWLTANRDVAKSRVIKQLLNEEAYQTNSLGAADRSHVDIDRELRLQARDLCTFCMHGKSTHRNNKQRTLADDESGHCVRDGSQSNRLIQSIEHRLGRLNQEIKNGWSNQVDLVRKLLLRRFSQWVLQSDPLLCL